MLLAPAICQAASAVDGAPGDATPGGLTAIDYLIIAVYALSTILMGWYYSRRQNSINEYFIGSGNMNPILIGVSLFATLLSTISYLSMPGEAAGKGPVSLMGLTAYPVVLLVIGFVFIPLYMRQRATSAYELLEQRLGLSIRLLGATMFLALRLVWMMLMIYLAAAAMSVMIGVDYWVVDFSQWSISEASFADATMTGSGLSGEVNWDGSQLRITSMIVIVAITGLVSVIYTSLGGLRAVVVTDFFQSLLLFGGALLVIGTVTWDMGGLSWFPTQWHSNWDTQPLFSFDPKTRMTMLGTFISISVWYVATSAGDQTSVQRFMATCDVRSARRALITQLCVGGTVVVTLHLVGFALLGFYEANPQALPSGMDIKSDADRLFPRFISYEFPAGISGLVVAGMFAAAMSSIDSGVNSITAVFTRDYLDRLGLLPKSEAGNLRLTKFLALAIGVAIVLGSAYMKYIPGNITAVTNKSASLLTTPIFALFFFALFVRFARPAAVWVASICGIATAACIAFSGPLVVLLHTQFGVDPAQFGVELMTRVDPTTGAQSLVTAARQVSSATGEMRLMPLDPISFQWIGPVSLLVNVSVGVTLSWLLSTWSSRHAGKVSSQGTNA